MGLGAEGDLVNGRVDLDHLVQKGLHPLILCDLVDVRQAVDGHEGTAYVGGKLPALQQGGGVTADAALVEVLGVAAHGVGAVASRRGEEEMLGDRLQSGQGELVPELLVVLAESPQIPGMARELLLVDHGILLGVEIVVLVGVLGERLHQSLHAGVTLPRHFVVADKGQQGAALLVPRPVGAVLLKDGGHLVVVAQESVVGSLNALVQLGTVEWVLHEHRDFSFSFPSRPIRLKGISVLIFCLMIH